MDRNSILLSLASEISPSYAMKINNVNIDDQQLWADNLQDTSGLFPSSPMRGIMASSLNNGDQSVLESPAVSTSCANTLSTEYYNFNFRMGTPIAGKDFDLTPTFSHG